jgi:transposase-like protein
MKLHANAALSLNQRRRMVGRVIGQGWSIAKAAEAAEVSDRICSKWVQRYRAEGEAGLMDRSSAPAWIPHRTPDDRVEVIIALRRLRMTSAEIALCLGMALSTVSAVLLRVGLGKLSRLQLPEPPNRYERRHAGELLHVDVNKLGAITGTGIASAAGATARTPTGAHAGAGRPRAGSSCTSASTTPPAWPTPKSSRTKGRPLPWASCAARSLHHPRLRGLWFGLAGVGDLRRGGEGPLDIGAAIAGSGAHRAAVRVG